ncbi:methyltransferase domain-containing protein [Rhizobium halophytocola]|uniref:SAM-dependent methyltransferase n=1 Tax=Rhizobium halophytocola TaxID=735519 RepID=A0ABS4E2A8_9HYPH|nr:methyltransferase domain-containing protein [Rhizobium halophytocola]MBP1852067.1 SAM-dependent methyltransferase [Rhizobium halophytocola]
MEQLFDLDLVTENRRRALKNGDRSAAFLMDIAAVELAERLALTERHFDEALEIGGVIGEVARLAVQTGKIGRLRRIETDAAFATPDEEIIVAPLETVPVEPESVNLILSPLSLHLANDMPGMLIQMRRALKPDGLLLAAIPAAGTLGELRDVLLSAEAELSGGASPRVVPFGDLRDIGGLLQRAGFALPVVDSQDYTVRYDSLFPLMRDLRAMGMSNPLTNRSRRPVSRALFLRAAELYAQRYSDPDGRIRATFSVVYVSGWAPDASQQKPLKPGSAKMRLADALKAGTPSLPEDNRER